MMVAFTTSVSASALQFTINGHDRFEINGFFNPDAASGGVGTKDYWTHRLYLKPSLLIDDHFTIFTEWKLLEYNSPTALSAPNGGTLAGASNGSPADGIGSCTGGSCDHYFGVTRAWLDWTNDWGQFRVGRAPRDWGLGMVYNAGNDPLDDWQSTEDLIQYTLPLGFVSFTGGFGKLYENRVESDADDGEDYFFLITYDNPEIELNTGFMYNRALRNAGARNNYHFIDVFGVKHWGGLKLSGEFAYVFGSSTTGSITYSNNSFGFLGLADWKVSRFTTKGLFAYATGDSNQTDTSTKTFQFFSNNVKPAVIMFNEDVGAINASAVSGSANYNSIKFGPAIGRFHNDGAIVFKVGEEIQIVDRFSTELDFIYALLATTGVSPSRDLGFEVDAHATYHWYDNFFTSLSFGYYVTGDAYGSSPDDVWALVFKGVLNF
jgi:hypothetical protein